MFFFSFSIFLTQDFEFGKKKKRRSNPFKKNFVNGRVYQKKTKPKKSSIGNAHAHTHAHSCIDA